MQDPNFVIPLIDKKLTDAIRRKYIDVPYADVSPSQKLDMYFPNQESDAPYPVIVYFHGGAFMIGTKQDDALEPMLRATEHGYVVISAEYRKSGEARFPAMVYDAKTVIRFVRAKAQEYHFDPNRIAVWGPSSGGWLVSMLGVTAFNPAFEDKSLGYATYSSEVNAVIDWCGPCGNFLEMDKAFRISGAGLPDHDDPLSPESQFLGAPIPHVPELCRLSAPITYVNPFMPPFCIFHGEKDQVVPAEQSICFAEQIKAVAGAERVELHIEPGKLHHGHPWYHETWVSDACIAFLDRVFSKAEMQKRVHHPHHSHHHGGRPHFDAHGAMGKHEHSIDHRMPTADNGTHCDGCPKNCSLNSPQCHIGAQKAKQAGADK